MNLFIQRKKKQNHKLTQQNLTENVNYNLNYS